LEYVKRFVEAGAEINFYGWPPLSYAAFNGHTAIVDYLLKRGAEIDAKTQNGSTALFFAARFGHIEAVKLLLKNEADPTIANENGETAVDWAMKNKHTDIEDLLRAAGGRSGKSVVIEMSK
jgi:ankyrin repeat protein